MNKAVKTIAVVLIVILALAMLSIIAYNWIPGFRAIVNNQLHAVQQADDRTAYETRKKVEDTARAMISSYEADAAVYTQYQNSDNPEQQSWAEQAKMRANRTASTYNNYLLANRYVWSNNIPGDISMELPLIP